jgi:DNA-binding transcriptional LysR family regulator
MINRAGEMAAFAQAVEAGSLSAGGRSLGLTPSAMSRLVARLEERLGVRLLQRTTRRLVLTAEGSAFYEQSKAILAEIDAIEASITRSRLEPRGLLRVSLSHSFGMSQVIPRVPMFAARYPEVELDLVFADHVVDLVAEGFDVAIRLGVVEDESLIARRLGEHGRAICAAPSYVEAHGTPNVPQDLARHRCVTIDAPAHLNVWPFRQPDGRIERLTIRGAIHSNNGAALHAFILQGAGIGRTPDFIAKPDLAAGRLVHLLSPYDTAERTPIHAVWPHRKHLAAKVRAFVDFLAQSFGPSPPWLL